MSQRDPIRVYVTHNFGESDDYGRVFEYLESARNFFYRNCSAPDAQPQGSTEEARREVLRRQIEPAEAVIALASLYAEQPDALLFQLHFAKASHKSVLLLPPFGRESAKIKAFEGLVDEYVGLG